VLSRVQVSPRSFSDYQELIGPELFNRIKNKAEKLKNIKIAHINATSSGGGVAEILWSLIPLLKDLGLDVDWYTIPSNPIGEDFFRITKKIHNALQGKSENLNLKEQKTYLSGNRKLAGWMGGIKPDIWIVHDPQPLAALSFLPQSPKAIWRCHLDMTQPCQQAWEQLKDFLRPYQAYVFSLSEFVPKEVSLSEIFLIPPAIDPLISKNKPLSLVEAQAILERQGIDVNKPLITQVSRFDPWKDPLGVIQAYRIAKKNIPDLQLVLMGLFLANDDPEALAVFKEVEREADNDRDIFLFSLPNQLRGVDNERMVNALQVASDAVIQKSVREGFGLVVAEAMWKEKPVIGGKVGGIKLQIEDGENGFLVESPKEAAEKIVRLLQDKNLARSMGRAAREKVRQKFLLPRLTLDWLKVLDELA